MLLAIKKIDKKVAIFVWIEPLFTQKACIFKGNHGSMHSL